MSGAAVPVPAAGARIGADLTVLGIIDGGGREPVCIVWHHRAWCPMACKLFRSSAAARREAAILSAVAHPNVVRLLGLGAPAHLLMEFLEGPPLSRLIDTSPQGRLKASDALRVAIHLGAALEHVHGQGYLHLDVKPANVIVARGGRPILFDFGTARRQSARRPRDPAGTDPYIAPEECLLQDATPAADVFGLGVTLYEMLTGELPFPKGDDGDPFPQTGRPPVPLREHRRGLPSGLDELVLRCLARDPAARPPLARLLPALNGFIRGGPAMWPPGFRPDAPARRPVRPTARPRMDAARA
jgi:serine/threonine protein kinase